MFFFYLFSFLFSLLFLPLPGADLKEIKKENLKIWVAWAFFGRKPHELERKKKDKRDFYRVLGMVVKWGGLEGIQEVSKEGGVDVGGW